MQRALVQASTRMAPAMAPTTSTHAEKDGPMNNTGGRTTKSGRPILDGNIDVYGRPLRAQMVKICGSNPQNHFGC